MPLTLLLAEFLQLWRQVGVAQGGTQAVLVFLLHKSTQQGYDMTLFCGQYAVQSNLAVLHKSTLQRYDMTLFCAPCAQVNTAKV